MMYCCLCDLQQRHHPTPSCEGCACFFMGDVIPNPFAQLSKFAERVRKAFEGMPKDVTNDMDGDRER